MSNQKEYRRLIFFSSFFFSSPSSPSLPRYRLHLSLVPILKPLIRKAERKDTPPFYLPNYEAPFPPHIILPIKEKIPPDNNTEKSDKATFPFCDRFATSKSYTQGPMQAKQVDRAFLGSHIPSEFEDIDSPDCNHRSKFHFPY